MDYYCYWKIGQYWGSFTIEGFGKVVVIKDPISFLFKASIKCSFTIVIGSLWKEFAIEGRV